MLDTRDPSGVLASTLKQSTLVEITTKIESLQCKLNFQFLTTSYDSKSIQSKNRLQQKGVLKRFSMNCYGKQMTLEDIRAEKTKAFERLRGKRGSKEYEEYFLRYTPGEDKKRKPAKSRKASTKAKQSRKTRVRRK